MSENIIPPQPEQAFAPDLHEVDSKDYPSEASINTDLPSKQSAEPLPIELYSPSPAPSVPDLPADAAGSVLDEAKITQIIQDGRRNFSEPNLQKLAQDLNEYRH